MGPIATRPRMTLMDLDALPDDGQRYEMIDGEVFVTPAPSGAHNQLADRIGWRLDDAAPEHFQVITGYQLHLTGEQRLIPDVCVVRAEAFRLKEAIEPPLIVVEVLSPSNAAFDLSEKMAAYAAFGVPYYWVAEPSVPTIAVLALGAHDGRYALMAEASGSEVLSLDEPFPVEFAPATLIRHRPVDASLEARLDLPAAVRTALAQQA